MRYKKQDRMTYEYSRFRNWSFVYGIATSIGFA